MNLQELYYKLPYPLRSLAFNALGAKQAAQRYGPEFEAILRALKESEHLDENAVKARQLSALANVVDHAYLSVPYYRQSFDKVGYRAGDLTSHEYLKELPFLTKEELRNNYSRLISRSFSGKAVVHGSSGTTGLPVKVLLPTRLKGAFNYATLYRFYGWAGVDPGVRRLSVAGRLITARPPYAMVNGAERQLYVSSQHLNDENMEDIAARIQNFDPKFVQGHPTALDKLSRYINEAGIDLNPTAVFPTSETLFPDQRLSIESAFGGTVFDTYGMGEMVLMASECEFHSGMHFAPEYGVSELVETPFSTAGIGELVGTSLQNFAMPLIRYRTGDLASASSIDCQCGRSFPKVDRIEGRMDDSLLLANGGEVLPVAVRQMMRQHDVGEFQIVQAAVDELTVRVLVREGYAEGQGRAGRSVDALRELVGHDASINTEISSEAIIANSGKRRMIYRQF